MENSDAEMSDTDMVDAASHKLTDVRLIQFLVRSYQSVTMVESQAFIRFTKLMNADYVMPTRKAITKKILPEMFRKSMEEQKCIVKQEAETICLTVDRWMAVKYEDSLIAITAHFITSDYTFKSVLLKCCYCERNSKDLEVALTETCSEWEITGKINWCITDDGADIVEAVESLGWNHNSCVALKLNLALQNSLKLCDKTVLKVQKIVSYFDSNFAAVQVLDEYQTKQGIAEPKELLDSENTSWATKYDMIERFLTLQEAIKATIAEQNDNTDLNITNDDWIKLKQLCKLLKPFKEATEALGYNNYTYATIVLPILNGLKDVLQEIHKQPDYYCTVKEIAECIKNELNEQFDKIGDSEPNLALCTILDPRYKLSMFLYKSDADGVKSNLVSEVQKLMDSKSPTDLLKMEEGPIMANNENGDLSLWRRRSMFLEKRQSDRILTAQQEVESYLWEDLTDSDPCTWWKSNKSKYPHLAKLFKSRCNKVATSKPSALIFTEQGINLCINREMLSLRKAEMIMFLAANLNEDDYLRLMPEIDDDLRAYLG